MNDECAFCNGSGVELVDGLGVDCVWCDSVAAVIAEDAAAREPINAQTVKAAPPSVDAEAMASLGLTLAVLREAFNAGDSAKRLANMDVPRAVRTAFSGFEESRALLASLTAERDGLADMNRLFRVAHEDSRLHVIKVESELTKARELLDEAATAVGEYGDSLIGRCNAEAGAAMLDLERKLRAHQHQSAPAAKEHVEDGKASDA